MATLRELLGEYNKEGMTLAEAEKALKKIRKKTKKMLLCS